MSEHSCITLEDVREARERIKDEAVLTPLMRPDNLAKLCGCNLSLKVESLQKCKAFKFRGALNKMKTLQEGTTVVAVSAGNHSQGVALAATLCKCKSIIYMPENAPMAKVNATKHYGGQVIQIGETFDDAKTEMEKALKENPDWVFVPPYNDKYIIAGTGTIAAEIHEQCPELDTVVVPIGGGGLISGIAYTIKKLNPKVRVVGVQMASCPITYELYNKEKKRFANKIAKETKTPLADGIAVKSPGNLNLDIIYHYVDDVVVVSEDDVALAVALLAERCKLVCEGAGATSLAAVYTKKFFFEESENVCCVLSGGNIELNMLSRCIDRALFLRKTRRMIQLVLPYGTANYSNFCEILVNNHISVLSTLSLPHVDVYANKEHYSMTIDVPNNAAFENVKNECASRGWIISELSSAPVDE
ncbi:threonine ammonia-lyase [Histomonas meleagridis]|uniref:threonine ammonia-lyase n=1 Tax=Histomonas meleagridis TaxID=135588 RepID=UPI003559898D|nr:threonine ammonia-lyase [Histomonas meleagridis]KAH0803977.1 threonine ammonia-lyase [Histomonas meleagridis]